MKRDSFPAMASVPTQHCITSLVCIVSFFVAMQVSADQNPPTCTFSGATVGLSPFADSNATMSILGGQVTVGQTIYYQAAVSQSLDTYCGFEGGVLLLTLPDGSPVDVTPDGGVPLVCGS